MSSSRNCPSRPGDRLDIYISSDILDRLSLPHILLGLLREPASGYDLKAEFEKMIRHYWSAELSQIYPTLKRMEGQGWLASATEPSDRGPDRRGVA